MGEWWCSSGKQDSAQYNVPTWNPEQLILVIVGFPTAA